MTAITLLMALALAVGVKFGAEDRPGFDERTPLA
jgi:hypothetical protein